MPGQRSRASPGTRRFDLEPGDARRPRCFPRDLCGGLSMDDEPFLESALDDKHAEVRRAAAELLSRLAESRLCQRMIARVGPLVQFSEHKGKLQIDMTLPDQYTKDMARDGVEKKVQGMGERNGWLYQMIADRPAVLLVPSHWQVAGRTAQSRRRFGMGSGR